MRECGRLEEGALDFAREVRDFEPERAHDDVTSEVKMKMLLSIDNYKLTSKRMRNVDESVVNVVFARFQIDTWFAPCSHPLHFCQSHL